ncbi:hypothetical protein JD844_000100 [Phrynosoma platyrhinos]|uniref:Protein kinase domain-containing protein n=1 Tax=Phrynosoma platyrhinos TaxID=52577 RepID=A0ABQ7SQ78_PHRPL|nr:hypothetical protein JD844_000100 [Phrynosoma platyrhinos]
MLEKFADLNANLGDIGQGLLLQLQVEQNVLASFEKSVVSKEGCQDLAEDKVDIPMEIIEIQKSLITNRTLLMEAKKYLLFKGEYYKSPVAIKVFRNPLTTNTQKVRRIFEEEIKTLKRLESPYILRMYGICIDETGETFWASSLHQTGDKGQLHRCINSTNFLVAKGYCVKLSGFKLEQTESSISGRLKEKTPKEVASSAYICPEGLASVNHPYSKASEIYSFGIVLWEIATGKIPFAVVVNRLLLNQEQAS